MIDVTLSGRVPRFFTHSLALKALEETFRATKHKPEGSVSLAFLTQPEIRRLNRKWRKIDRPTDVLSFAPPAPEGSSTVRERVWGDLFLAPAYIRHEAETRKISFEEELLRNVVHGMLHLFGYDHATPVDESRMFGLQEPVISKLIQSV